MTWRSDMGNARDSGKQCLLAYRYPDGEWIEDAAMFHGQIWIYRDGGIVLEQRWTHWQPMPEPPEEEAATPPSSASPQNTTSPAS